MKLTAENRPSSRLTLYPLENTGLLGWPTTLMVPVRKLATQNRSVPGTAATATGISRSPPSPRGSRPVVLTRKSSGARTSGSLSGISLVGT